MKKAYVLLFEGYADWELGHVLAELIRLGQREVVSIGFNEKPLASMGGLQVKPHQVLSQIDFEDILIFIIPGGYMWEKEYSEDVINDLLHKLDERNIPITAICACYDRSCEDWNLKGQKTYK
jgi:putative intracellular protease/amidase